MHGRMIVALAAALIATSALAQPAAPELSLPTPPGEAWQVIQGYGCGTHDDPPDYYALDLIAADGATGGAPVRAAADGLVLAWVEPSGTLILDHGEGFFTQYTHMEPWLTEPGLAVARGSVVGYVGERGTPGNPHLHFALLTQPPGADPEAYASRRSLPLAFREGYALPEIGGCSQHGGALLVAAGDPIPRAPLPPRRLRAEPIYCPERGMCMR